MEPAEGTARPPFAIALVLGVVATVATGVAMWASPVPWTLTLDAGLSFLGQTVPAFWSWARGAVPAWTDLLWGGFPLLAEPTTAALYPPHAIAFVATLAAPLRFFDVALALHVGLLVAGSAAFVRALGAGVGAMVLAGVLVVLCPIAHGNAIANVAGFTALAWVPWVLTAAEQVSRPSTPRLGAAMWLGCVGLAAQVLAGMPEHALYTGIVAASWLVLRRGDLAIGERAVRVTFLAAGALALSAPQTLTTLAYLPATTRAGDAPSAELASLWIRDPRSLLVPGLMSPVTAFAGVATLGLAAAPLGARRPGAAILLGIAAVTLALALGPQVGLYWWLHRVPPFSFFRAPIKLYAFAEFSIVWAAALGADELWRRRDRHVFGTILVGLSLVEHLAFAALDDRAAITGMYWQGLSAERLEELSAIPNLRRHFPNAPPPLVLDARQDGHGFSGSLPAIVDIATLQSGGVSLLPRGQAMLFYRGAGSDLSTLLGVRYVIFPIGACDWALHRWRWSFVESAHDFCVLENPAPRPRYEILRKATAVESFDDMVKAIRKSPAAPVPVVAPPEVVADLGRSEVIPIRQAPGDVDVAVAGAKRMLLLARQSFVPGWRVLVDGEPVTPYPAAGLYFAVPIPSGAHRIRLVYEARGFVPGIAVFLGWTFATLAVAWVRRRR